MSSKYYVTHIMGHSSDGNAIIDVNVITRTLAVTPLTPSARLKPYRSLMCGHIMCPYPHLTCVECHDLTVCD